MARGPAAIGALVLVVALASASAPSRLPSPSSAALRGQHLPQTWNTSDPARRRLITGPSLSDGSTWERFNRSVLLLEFPFTRPDSTVGVFLCTGTLVDPVLIVTAPQCLPTNLRTITATANWDGADVQLGTAFKVYAGNQATPTEVGHMASAKYVNAASEGAQIAAIVFVPSAAGTALLTAASVAYRSDEPGQGQLGVAAGYGPNVSATGSNDVVAQSGARVLRQATLLITSTGTASSPVSLCYVRAWGGQLYMSEEPNLNGGLYNEPRLCARGGDLGAPFFVQNIAVQPNRWELAGIFVNSDDSDCLGSPGATMSFTSLAFRSEWVRARTSAANSVSYVPPACPAASPSNLPSSSPSRTPSRTPSPIPLMALPSPEPPFFQRSVNLVWVLLLAGALAVVSGGIFAYVYFRQRRIAAYFKVSPALKAELARASAGQKSVVEPTEYEAAQAERAERARKGEFTASTARRGSVVAAASAAAGGGAAGAAAAAEALAAAEAARNARKDRRRASVATGGAGLTLMTGSQAAGGLGVAVAGGSSGADGNMGSSRTADGGAGAAAARGGFGGEANTTAPAAEAGPTAGGRRASAVGGGGGGGGGGGHHRRASLAQARERDRAYDGTGAGGAVANTRYSVYEGPKRIENRPDEGGQDDGVGTTLES